MTSSPTFKYVDLFAGCGGLSLGLERMGGELIVAVERSDMAAETFMHNLVETVPSAEEWNKYVSSPLENQVKRRVVVKELRALLDDKKLMDKIADETPDVVAGGPPCQGFSLAGRRNPEDLRNQLPWQFLEFVEKTSPKIVIIENVVGMRHKFSTDSDDVFKQLRKALQETGEGYVVQAVQVNAIHYGAPQHRPRLMLIGLRSDFAAKKSVHAADDLWVSNFIDKLDPSDLPALAPVPSATSVKVPKVGDAIGDLQQYASGPPSEYLREMKVGLWPVTVKKTSQSMNHNVRVHQDRTQKRFRLYQYLASQNIDARILGIPDSDDIDSNQKRTILNAINSAELPAISADKTVLAKTTDELLKLIVELRTKKHSQRVLDWDEPARTVVTIGDDYVHPREARTFTVRELARFQGFPDDFEFRAKETTGGLNRRNEVPQYSQVGNAVSPFLAKAVGQMVNKILKG